MKLLKYSSLVLIVLNPLIFAQQLSEQQMRLEFEYHDVDKDGIITVEQFKTTAEKQIQHFDQLKVQNQDLEILVEKITENVFLHDKNEDGLDFQEFKLVVVNRPKDQEAPSQIVQESEQPIQENLSQKSEGEQNIQEKENKQTLSDSMTEQKAQENQL